MATWSRRSVLESRMRVNKGMERLNNLVGIFFYPVVICYNPVISSRVDWVRNRAVLTCNASTGYPAIVFVTSSDSWTVFVFLFKSSKTMHVKSRENEMFFFKAVRPCYQNINHLLRELTRKSAVKETCKTLKRWTRTRAFALSKHHLWLFYSKITGEDKSGRLHCGRNLKTPPNP